MRLFEWYAIHYMSQKIDEDRGYWQLSVSEFYFNAHLPTVYL